MKEDANDPGFGDEDGNDVTHRTEDGNYSLYTDSPHTLTPSIRPSSSPSTTPASNEGISAEGLRTIFGNKKRNIICCWLCMIDN